MYLPKKLSPLSERNFLGFKLSFSLLQELFARFARKKALAQKIIAPYGAKFFRIQTLFLFITGAFCSPCSQKSPGPKKLSPLAERNFLGLKLSFSLLQELFARFARKKAPSLKIIAPCGAKFLGHNLSFSLYRSFLLALLAKKPWPKKLSPLTERNFLGFKLSFSLLKELFARLARKKALAQKIIAPYGAKFFRT